MKNKIQLPHYQKPRHYIESKFGEGISTPQLESTCNYSYNNIITIKAISSMLIITLLFACNSKDGGYVCPPCNLPCDKLTFSKAGTCPHCHMALIKKADLESPSALVMNQIDIKAGSGVFLIEGSNGNKDKPIKIYYHRPQNFKPDDKILLVIPGAGRNGDSYRDAWIQASEKYGVLILSPMYAEEDYPFEDYHLCGLMSDLNLEHSIQRVEGTNMVRLDEDKFTYTINANPKDWIFNDFDRIFDLVIKATDSKQTKYDIFGHSAGGQILHRFAIFQSNSKADRILASNSGFYTSPDFDIVLPFGIKNTALNEENIKSSFSKKLILFIGELDNQNETGGTLLRSKTADAQGLHRLERAHFFYNQAKSLSKTWKCEFNWNLKIIPGIGHDHRKMGENAASFLYDNQ